MNAIPSNGLNVCALIVTYHPDSGFLDRAATIAGQVSHTIVVDNSGVAFSLEQLGGIPNLTILRNETNVGLGAALNQGMRFARRAGHQFALLFDQDSTPLPGMAATLARIRDTFESDAGTTILCSNFTDERTEKNWIDPESSPNRLWIDAPSMTTSGSLVPLEVFEFLGPFREDLFVDLIDMEYSLRARSRGCRVLVSVRPLMMHRVGAKQRRRLLWRTVWPSYHSPERRFLMARNTIRLVREYGAGNPHWASREIQSLAKATLLVLLFEDEKRAKLAATAQGLLAGLKEYPARSVQPEELFQH